jgi:hypothetical protein
VLIGVELDPRRQRSHGTSIRTPPFGKSPSARPAFSGHISTLSSAPSPSARCNCTFRCTTAQHLRLHPHLRKSRDGSPSPRTTLCARQLRGLEITQSRADRASSGPRRECHHPKSLHTHGMRAAYVRDRCRCGECTAANAAASNQTHRAKTFGRWQPHVTAAPARAHIESLRSAGIGIDQIARLAGLSSSHVRGLIGSVTRPQDS